MDLVRTLHRLAVLSSFRPSPEDLARALCVQVLGDFKVNFLQLLTLASNGQWLPVASFGNAEALSGPLQDRDVPVLQSLDLAVGQPAAKAWGDLDSQHQGASAERPAEFVICLPLMIQGLLKGSIVMGTDVDPHLPRNLHFWETIALACAPLVCKQAQEADPISPSALLSSRQLAILNFVSQGLTNLQIGNRLGYSESTIGHDLVLAYERLGVRNRNDAVRAVRHMRSQTEALSSEAVA